MLRRASSIGMPRFCSSKTRLNSSAIGPFISSATRCRPEASPCPARSARLISSTASGMAATNCLIRRLLRRSSQRNGIAARKSRPQRDQRRSAAGTPTGTAAPATASPPTIVMNRLKRQVDVGLLVEQVEVLGVGDQPGPERRPAQVDRRGPGQDAAGQVRLLGLRLLLARRARRAAPRPACPTTATSPGPTPPTSTMTPMPMIIESIVGLFIIDLGSGSTSSCRSHGRNRLNPSGARAGGRGRARGGSPSYSSRSMKVGRMPVAMNSP